MPKDLIDYSKTVIYKICCLDKSIQDLYIGHTTNFTKRKYQHKVCCNDINNQLIDHSDSLLITFRNLILAKFIKYIKLYFTLYMLKKKRSN